MATRPEARAAAAIRSESSSEGAIGFSHHTCLPASSAAIAIRAWSALGVVIETASTPGSAISARQSSVEASKPNAPARQPLLDLAQHHPADDRRVVEYAMNAGPGEGVTFAHVARADQSDADRAHGQPPRFPRASRARPPIQIFHS